MERSYEQRACAQPGARLDVSNSRVTSSEGDGILFFDGAAIESARNAFADVWHGGSGASFGFSGNIESSVLVTSGGEVTIEDSTVKESEDAGLTVQPTGEFGSFARMTTQAARRLRRESLECLSDDAVSPSSRLRDPASHRMC
ncbi:MAG: right-handed parallel beta-helix repeat-containing protein [Myxococcota bacterium]